VFDRVLGLPAHPLLVHAAVVLVPLLALGGIVYAVAPFARRHLRWVVGLLAVAAAGAVTAAKLSGDSFSKHKNFASPEFQSKISNHSEFGNRTWYFTLGLAVVVLALVVLVRPVTAGGTRGRGPDDTLVAPRGGAPVILQVVFGVLTIGLAGVTLYFIFKTGDSGAHMVWDGF
jgi:cytochrome c biogenesis protein CcdA